MKAFISKLIDSMNLSVNDKILMGIVCILAGIVAGYLKYNMEFVWACFAIGGSLMGIAAIPQVNRTNIGK